MTFKAGQANYMFGKHPDRKGTKNPGYKDGRSLRKANCVHCNKEISWNANACRVCAGKYQRHLVGKDHPNWKGGKTPFSEAIKDSLQYTTWRTSIFERDNYTCQECNQISGRLEAHHLKPFSIIVDEFLQEYSEFSIFDDRETLLKLTTHFAPFWDTSNGQTLCKECHIKTDTFAGKLR